MRRTLYKMLFGVFFLACSNDFEPASRLTKLRLLGVSADKPYAHAGDTVKLQALAYDPAGRSIQWGWATCTNPAAATVMGCAASMDEGSFTLGGTEHSVALPSTSKVGLGAMVGVLVVACPGQLSVAPAGEVPFRCNDGKRDLDLSEYELGMKRLLLRSSDRNENPQVDEVVFDGAPWPETLVPEVSACQSDKVEDCPHPHKIGVAASRSESGKDELGTGFAEQLIVQYYASEGSFEWELRTADKPETRWIARPESAGKLIEMFFVARDDRGGISWTRRQIRVRAR